MKNYPLAVLVRRALRDALQMVEDGIALRTIVKDLLHYQLVELCPEGGAPVDIYNSLECMRDRESFRQMALRIDREILAPVIDNQKQRAAYVRACNEQRAKVWHEAEALADAENETWDKKYFAMGCRDYHLPIFGKDQERAIAAVHAHALTVDAAGIVPPFGILQKPINCRCVVASMPGPKKVTVDDLQEGYTISISHRGVISREYLSLVFIRTIAVVSIVPGELTSIIQCKTSFGVMVNIAVMPCDVINILRKGR